LINEEKMSIAFICISMLLALTGINMIFSILNQKACESKIRLSIILLGSVFLIQSLIMGWAVFQPGKLEKNTLEYSIATWGWVVIGVFGIVVSTQLFIIKRNEKNSPNIIVLLCFFIMLTILGLIGVL